MSIRVVHRWRVLSFIFDNNVGTRVDTFCLDAPIQFIKQMDGLNFLHCSIIQNVETLKPLLRLE